MTKLARIGDQTLTADDFVKELKLNGRFNELLEEVLADKLMVHAGRRAGLTPTDEEVQQRADQVRRVLGLHRALDMKRWLDKLGLNVDDFEAFITNTLLSERMEAEIVNENSIASYFKLHSPKFDAVLLSHIVVDSEGKARELVAILEDEPDMFEELAREHSLADTRMEAGYIGRVTRGSMASDIEGKVFNAASGEVLGPYTAINTELFEIFVVNDRRDATLDNATETEIRKLIKEDWLAAQASEFGVEVC